MPPDTTEKNVNHSTKLFGLGREGKRPGDPLVVTENTTAWEIYNHKAAEVDRELIKDWNDSLNTLLIFTALYSAVLTAFIVESMKLLEEDPTETTRDILLVVSRQLANNSFPPFEPVVYQTPQYAIAVNGLFFTSLSCALIAALLAVLALQWVANYDMGLNTSAPKKRALQRHIRFRGIEKWKMSELIAALPLLIFVSLFLFFIGIADWLWHMNRAISGIVIGGIGVGVILYTVTNLISIINVDAPFRTPVSKELIGIMRQLIEKIRKIVASFSLSPTAADTQKHTIEETIGQPLTFMQREEKTFEGKDGVVLDSLAWLARNIEIATIAADSFIVLLKELTNVSALSLMDSKAIEDAPWNAIFEMLCTLYIDKKGYNPEELEAMRWVCKGMGIIPANFLSPTFHKFLDDLHVSCDESASGLAYFALYKQYHDQDTELWQCAWMMISAYAHISKTISQIGDNYFHFMLLHTKQKWPNLDMDNQTLLVEAMARAWTISSAVIRDGSSSVIIPFPLIQLIFDFVVPHVEDGKFEARYLAARNANTWGSEHWQDALDRLLGTMAQQIIHQINHNFNTLSNDMKELDLLSWLIESKQLGLDEQKDDFIWVMIDNFTKHDRSRDLDRITDTLCRGLNCKRASFEWIALVPILDDFLARLPPHSSHFYSNVIRFVERSLGSSGHAENSSDLDGLTQVRDPCLVWIVSWQCPNDVQFDLLTNPNFISWNDAIEDEFIRLFSIYKLGNIEDSDARIHLIRAIILDGPSNACFGILGHLNTYIFGKLSDNEKVIIHLQVS
ncbi:hypothetical protein CPB86DRAFT_493291 [Serendipita vermifera]|nr:hypothetical protein CPB86DRAFT_493291 [Serendipita vermifera]